MRTPNVAADPEPVYDNPFLSLRVIRRPDLGIDGYVYSHDVRCQGRIVAILPYMNTPKGRLYLVRSEITPCWGLTPQLSAITGGYEGGDIADDAVRELLEETGYAVNRDNLIPLGQCRASKSSDTLYSLFSVNLTLRIPGPASGDGSRLEAEATTRWLPSNQIVTVDDPQVSTMFVRLEAALSD